MSGGGVFADRHKSTDARLSRRRLLRSAAAGAAAVGLFGGVRSVSAAEYLVQPGDTVWSIAVRHGTTVDAIASASGLTDPGLIFVGQRLTIPDGASGATPAPAPPADTPSASSPPPPVSTPPAAAAPPPAGGSSTRARTGESSILASRRLVTYYGNPFSAQMGIFGELSKPDLVGALKARVAEYERAGGTPAVGALHMVVTVAQAGPGPDGLYRARMPAAVIQEYVDLAVASGLLFIADIQVGRSTVEAEVAAMRPFLEQPAVHLALDPEFDMWGAELPGIDLGHMTAAEVNHGVQVMAEIAARTGQPKIVIVHQFTASMLPDKASIVDDPRVDLAIVMDGFGGQQIKVRHYDWYVRDQLIEFGGIKLFIQQDTNLMTPADVVALTPSPAVVIYQ